MAAFDPLTNAIDLGLSTSRLIPYGADFWNQLSSGGISLSGRLTLVLEMTTDAGHWEMHPNGDELVVLITGSVDFVYEDSAGALVRVELREGHRAFLVPQGLWHRFEVKAPGLCLFATAGEGTQHRPL